MHTPNQAPFLPLQGLRVLSLALNLPGPAALLRCQTMGAQCIKVEPVPAAPSASADPMHRYSPDAYAQLHSGVAVLQAHLKTDAGQQLLHAQLAHTDVLLTSFRPSALAKLGLSWDSLHARYPQLCMVRIFGSTDAAEAEQAGHDLTYQAEAGLLDDGHLPPSLFADMSGALMASEAVLQCVLARSSSGQGHCLDIGLSQAAQWLALPRQWHMTTVSGDVGGAHAGYRMYRCRDGWVAMAALEPHFAQRLCHLVGLDTATGDIDQMRLPHTHTAIAAWLQQHSREAISAIATQCDIPLHLIAS